MHNTGGSLGGVVIVVGQHMTSILESQAVQKWDQHLQQVQQKDTRSRTSVLICKEQQRRRLETIIIWSY